VDILIDPYRFRAALKLVSPPYPVEFLDNATLSADFVGGNLYQLFPIESVGLVADLTGAVLTVTTTFVAYSMRESASLVADLDGGVLTVTTSFAVYSMRPESASLAAELTDAVLTVTTSYATYSMRAESASLSADFDGGTLV